MHRGGERGAIDVRWQIEKIGGCAHAARIVRRVELSLTRREETPQATHAAAGRRRGVNASELFGVAQRAGEERLGAAFAGARNIGGSSAGARYIGAGAQNVVEPREAGAGAKLRVGRVVGRGGADFGPMRQRADF